MVVLLQTQEISGSCSAPWQKQRDQNRIENRTGVETSEKLREVFSGASVKAAQAELLSPAGFIEK